jgi:hypothetical protein
MNGYPGLLRIEDHVVHDVMGKHRYGVVQQFRYDEGRRGPTYAAVQPASGGPRVWLGLDLLTPVSVR